MFKICFYFRRRCEVYLAYKYSILYHTAIASLFRPFTRRKPPLQLQTFSSANRTPDAIFAASIRQLYSLMINFRTRYQAANYTILWHGALLYVANSILQSPKRPGAQMDLLRCIQGYQGLYTSFANAEVILRGLLAMAIKKGLLTSSQSRKILSQMYERNKHRRLPKETSMTWIVDLDLALRDRTASQLQTLATKFEDLVVLDEYAMEPKETPWPTPETDSK
jgi:hypothetical protein